MVQAHNISYYTGLWDKYNHLKNDYQEKMQYEEYLYPDLVVTRPMSRFLSDHVVYPLINHGYTITGKVAAYTLSVFSSSHAKRLEEAWHDPVETPTLVNFAKWVQGKTITIAKQTPSEKPIFVYFHRALIVAARSFYILAKDTATLLEVPKGLHEYVSGYIDRSIEPQKTVDDPPKTYLGRVWRWIKGALEWMKNAFLYLICRISKAAEKPLQKMPEVKSLFQELKDDVKKASEYVQGLIIQKTHDYIEVGEIHLRRRVVAKMTEVSMKKGLNWGIHNGIKLAISYGVYKLAKESFVHYTQTHEIADQVELIAGRTFKVIGAYLFTRFMAPTVQALHDDYRPEFDEHASTASELVSQISLRNIFNAAHYLRDLL